MEVHPRGLWTQAPGQHRGDRRSYRAEQNYNSCHCTSNQAASHGEYESALAGGLLVEKVLRPHEFQSILCIFASGERR